MIEYLFKKCIIIQSYFNRVVKKMHKTIKVGIVGATGYTGIELIRLLQAHPYVEITCVTSETYIGKPLDEVYPHTQTSTLILQKLDIESIQQSCDLVFMALPHGHAMRVCGELLDSGKKIIDLGADFRLKNSKDYTQWYGLPPAKDILLANAHYGLPEISKKSHYADLSLIANPGCYPTAAILGVAPLLAAGIISLDHFIIDGKSGVSGAGRSLALGAHYCEVAENFKAYALAGKHRHTPEIEQAFSGLAGQICHVDFTPHLVPMLRGIFMTGYYKLAKNVSEEDIYKQYQTFYQHASFVRVLPQGTLPETKQVRGSNYCDIAVHLNLRTGTIITTSVIDNLIKGASGQAIQNMNLLYGFPETTGLLTPTIYP